MRGLSKPGFRPSRFGLTAKRPAAREALFFCILAIVAGLVVSCSSLPAETEEPEQVTIRQQALEYGRLGDDSLRSRSRYQTSGFHVHSGTQTF